MNEQELNQKALDLFDRTRDLAQEKRRGLEGTGVTNQNFLNGYEGGFEQGFLAALALLLGK